MERIMEWPNCGTPKPRLGHFAMFNNITVNLTGITGSTYPNCAINWREWLAFGIYYHIYKFCFHCKAAQDHPLNKVHIPTQYYVIHSLV